MATEETRYLTYIQAILLHMVEMRRLGEIRYGVFAPDLIASSLARPRHAATYESADVIRQAATLCFGLIKNHPWVGGNKRTATLLTETFLRINGWEPVTPVEERIEMVLAVESNRYGVDEIEACYHQRTTFTGKPQ